MVERPGTFYFIFLFLQAISMYYFDHKNALFKEGVRQAVLLPHNVQLPLQTSKNVPFKDMVFQNLRQFLIPKDMSFCCLEVELGRESLERGRSVVAFFQKSLFHVVVTLWTSFLERSPSPILPSLPPFFMPCLLFSLSLS